MKLNILNKDLIKIIHEQNADLTGAIHAAKKEFSNNVNVLNLLARLAEVLQS